MIHDAQLWLCELAALRKNTVDVQKPTVQITTNSRQHRYYDEVTDLFCRTDVASYMQGLTPFNCLRVTVSTEFICSGYKKTAMAQTFTQHASHSERLVTLLNL